MNNNFYFIIFLFNLLITYLFIPKVKNFCFKYEFFDSPNKRKQHKNPKPRIGGLAIFLAFIISSLISYFYLLINGIGTDLIGFFIIFGSCFFLIGFIDDLYNLSPFLRLFLEFLFAVLIVNYGIKVNSFLLPFVFSNSNIVQFTNTLNDIFSIILDCRCN